MMRYIKYFVLTLFLFFIFDLNVEAASCDKADIARLREIAENVSVNYIFLPDYENGFYNNFNLEISGITNELYVYFKEGMYDDLVSYKDTDNGNVSVGGYSSGDYKVYVASSNCGELLTEIDVHIPRFNRYSLDSRCDNPKYSDLDICDEWYEEAQSIEAIDLDYYFGDDDKSFGDKIVSFLKNNILFVAIAVVIIIGFVIIRARKRSVLE